MEILLKSSAILLIFYVFYRILLSKETFYIFNRVFLLFGVILSVVIPFVSIPIYKNIRMDFYSFEASSSIDKNNLSFEVVDNHIDYFQYPIFKIIYLGVIIFFIVRFIISIIKILISLKRFPKVEFENYNLVETQDDILPFSFFKTIVINPEKYTEEEYNNILQHELTHVRQWHSIDIVLSKILSIVLWFNPIVYLYKREIEQNLEFIADSRVKKQENSERYEFLLLKSVLPAYQLQLVNNFFSSPIKKRIYMINAEPSKPINRLKYIVIIPILSLFLYSFNTKEVFKVEVGNNEQVDKISFVHPLENYDKISSKFGNRVNPVLKEKKLHTGVDYTVKFNSKVLASAEGKVKSVGYNKSDGNYIYLIHKNNFETRYLHLKDYIVKSGDLVTQKQLIGHSGSSGNSSGPHLHFELLKDGKYTNPVILLPKIKTLSLNDFLKNKSDSLNLNIVKNKTYFFESLTKKSPDKLQKVQELLKTIPADKIKMIGFFEKDSLPEKNTVFSIKLNDSLQMSNKNIIEIIVIENQNS